MVRDSRFRPLNFVEIFEVAFQNWRAGQGKDQEEEEEEAVAPQPQHGNVDQEVVQAAANDDQNMPPHGGGGESSGQNQKVGQIQRNSSPDGNEEVALAANRGGESSLVQVDHSQEEEEGGKSSMKMDQKGSSSSSSSSSSSVSDGNLDPQEVETATDVESSQSLHEEVGQTSMISEQQRRSSASDPLLGNLDPLRRLQSMEQQERNLEDESENLRAAFARLNPDDAIRENAASQDIEQHAISFNPLLGNLDPGNSYDPLFGNLENLDRQGQPYTQQQQQQYDQIVDQQPRNPFPYNQYVIEHLSFDPQMEQAYQRYQEASQAMNQIRLLEDEYKQELQQYNQQVLQASVQKRHFKELAYRFWKLHKQAKTSIPQLQQQVDQIRQQLSLPQQSLQGSQYIYELQGQEHQYGLELLQYIQQAHQANHKMCQFQELAHQYRQLHEQAEYNMLQFQQQKSQYKQELKQQKDQITQQLSGALFTMQQFLQQRNLQFQN